jgi:hypothetical protein
MPAALPTVTLAAAAAAAALQILCRVYCSFVLPFSIQWAFSAPHLLDNGLQRSSAHNPQFSVYVHGDSPSPEELHPVKNHLITAAATNVTHWRHHTVLSRSRVQQDIHWSMMRRP